MSFGEKKKEMLVYFPRDNKSYIIRRDDLMRSFLKRSNIDGSNFRY